MVTDDGSNTQPVEPAFTPRPKQAPGYRRDSLSQGFRDGARKGIWGDRGSEEGVLSSLAIAPVSVSGDSSEARPVPVVAMGIQTTEIDRRLEESDGPILFDESPDDQISENDPDPIIDDVNGSELRTDPFAALTARPMSPDDQLSENGSDPAISTPKFTAAEKRELQLAALSRVNEHIQEAMVPWKRYIRELQNSEESEHDPEYSIAAYRLKAEEAWGVLTQAIEMCCKQLREHRSGTHGPLWHNGWGIWKDLPLSWWMRHRNTLDPSDAHHFDPQTLASLVNINRILQNMLVKSCQMRINKGKFSQSDFDAFLGELEVSLWWRPKTGSIDVTPAFDAGI